MHFTTDHEFEAAPAEVVAILCDAGFQRALQLPDLSLPEVVADEHDTTARVLKLRYEFVGHLDGIARKAIGNRKLTWLQELRLDTSSMSGTLSFAAEADPNKLHGEANIELHEIGGGRTRRKIDGDLVVRVPLIGGTAERKIVPGLVRRLDIEADAVRSTLANRQ